MYVKEGRVIVFEGPQRAGKTLTMSIFALSDYLKGRTVFSNIDYVFPTEPCKFSKLKLKKDAGQLLGSTITIDELNFYFDSRSSGTKQNKEFSYFLLQSKKQGINLYGTSHDLGMLDKRWRNNYDYLIKTQVLPENRPDEMPPQEIRLIIESGPVQKPFKNTQKLQLNDKLLGLYDNTNLLDPFED